MFKFTHVTNIGNSVNTKFLRRYKIPLVKIRCLKKRAMYKYQFCFIWGFFKYFFIQYT